MGVKRPFNDEFSELSSKHCKQTETAHVLAFSAKTLPSDDVPQDHDTSVHEGNFSKFICNGIRVSEAEAAASLPNKDVENVVVLSCVTSSPRGEVAGVCPVSPTYCKYDYPQRRLHLEDTYSTLLDHSPRRRVPVGPNHQAVVPFWGGEKKSSDALDTFRSEIPPLHSPRSDDGDSEEKLMGTCIIPMPDSNSSPHGVAEVGIRRFCGCLDEGSVRCVRQHVRDAQEKLKNTIGEEKFEDLGFYDMGEEVASRWSEEEEHLFHKVVFSNPQSLGRNFWKHLSVTFPYRTKKEIVSYYFNVFMLRRRAAQNRSKQLDIDSDDDEWHGSFGCQNAEDDEDSAVESLADFDDQSKLERLSVEDDDEYSNYVHDDGDDDEDDDNNGDTDLGNSMGVVCEEDDGIDHCYGANTVKSSEKGRLDSAVNAVDKTGACFCGTSDVQDDSCTSFEFEFNINAPCHPGDARAGIQVHEVDHDKHLFSKTNGVSDGISHMYILDPCDTKLWDARYNSSPMKGVDLLPTCNIIEEIFGLGSWDKKTMDD